jgi:hypothetical protein
MSSTVGEGGYGRVDELSVWHGGSIALFGTVGEGGDARVHEL